MDALSSLTSILKPIGQVVSAGANLFEGYKQQQYQDKLRSLAQNPSKLNAYAQQFVQPLNAGLLRGTENEAQAYAAERGLAESPALEQQIVSQAVGPLIQSNEDKGYQYALSALGLGGGANPPNTGAGLTQLFSGLGGLSQIGQGSNPPSVTAGQNDPLGLNIPAPVNLPQSPTPNLPPPTAPDVSMQDWYNSNAFGPAYS